MDENAFRKYLKKFGKQDNVVDGLVQQARRFEAYLAGEKGKDLDRASLEDLQAYTVMLEAESPGRTGTRIRGVIFYYRFSGRAELAAYGHDLREQGTSKTRRVFPLKEFRGVKPETVQKLEIVGIKNVEHMLRAGCTPQSRQALAEKTGVPLEQILELVKLSDISRLGGMKGVRARLYYEAGADTMEKIAAWEPEALLKRLAEFVERTGFDGIAPLPKEVRNCVRDAREIEKVVVY